MTRDCTNGGLNLVKLCVGADAVEDLVSWQARHSAERAKDGQDPRPRHVTRMWPRRQEELLAGGSLYWVIRGLILVRQRIEALDRVTGTDGVQRCAIVLDRRIVRTEARPRGAFQGWRYLDAADAPPDLPDGPGDPQDLPQSLQSALADLGVLTR